MLTITLSAAFSLLKPIFCKGNHCPSVIEAQKLVLFSGLYLIAFGKGGIYSSLLPLGADQFEDRNSDELEKKKSFFNWFYFSICFGSLISSTILVWVEENIDWALGFGISALFVALALGAFLYGTPIYRLQRPGGSPLKRILQVLVAALRKTSIEVPTDNSHLYEVPLNNLIVKESWKLVHSNDFRFLDRAATISESDARSTDSPSPWRLCSVTQVEELKILLRLLPIWVGGVIYSVSYAQMSTTFIEQGNTMETKIGCFSFPPASLFAFETLIVILWVFIYDTLLVNIGKKFIENGHGISWLQRMGIGFLLMMFGMCTVALVEAKRLECVRVGKTMSIAWQLPQYFIFGVSEVFSFVGQIEFFNYEAPNTMKSTCNAFFLLTMSLGKLLEFSCYYISDLFYYTRRKGWLDTC
ncbi:PREDICTED: protein NRT1/ PTR FAMILY 8.3-like isoform X2 [Nelumbo nucifera]|nr:PREDICTED: protein NRT1/ PTR FAMILY 8.3-like isoform X2 [Nelumbo nucifera]